MRLSIQTILSIFFVSILSNCGGSRPESTTKLTPEQFASRTWEETVAQARGTTVNYAMWAGDESRNRYFQGLVAESLKRQYGITLRIFPCNDVAEVVNKLLNEKGAGKMQGGSIDFVWINGENFRTARQGSILWGPFANRLPNIKYYDELARARDFGTSIDDYEAPWLRAQFVLAYDQARTPDPPRSIPALKEWIKSHPGKFTYLAPPDFTGSAFIRHLLFYFGGGPEKFTSGFDEELYRRAAGGTVKFLNEIKPDLWRRGETYPSSPREADRLFANNEIDMTMNYSPSFASEKIKRGEYPATTRTFIFEEGTIGNYSYLAIPFNAANAAGALVVINYLMSPEHLIEQARVIGTQFPIGLERLSAEERVAVEALPRDVATLPAQELMSRLLPEADALYLERLEKDWMKTVLQK